MRESDVEALSAASGPGAPHCKEALGTQSTLDVSATPANLLNGHRDDSAMSRTDEGKL